ncbi:MAG: Secreted protein containing C-terminal beta-propeller domain distantly related to WD-40 repeat [Parcubacteria group bacterium Gr01-1014_20]|nr:MAG: Secreted protein containing C-terminal beta-propeller domain distantly related to WD-40 repeat [Parcubacteria group bacterium Gr01-1014_20]
MHKKISTKTALAVIVVFGTLCALFVTSWLNNPEAGFPVINDWFPKNPGSDPQGKVPEDLKSDKTLSTFVKFKSEVEFKEYLSNAENLGGFGFSGVALRQMAPMMESDAMPGAPSPIAGADNKSTASPDRVSGTNVQVSGIDEPDILKTNGKEIYLSLESFYYYGRPMPMMEPAIGEDKRIAPDYYPQNRGETKVLKAFPPESLALRTKIQKSGNLLLSGKILVIFEGQSVFGYDVSNPDSPTEKWRVDLKDNSYLSTSRLHDGKIYLVTQTWVNSGHPCPFIPVTVKGSALSIPCTEIYHPRAETPADVTYTAMILDPETGSVKNHLSFVGTSGSSVIYMSPNALYVAYSYPGDYVKIFLGFFKEKARDLVSSSVLTQLEKLEGYDISQSSKMNEFQMILDRHLNSLEKDDRLKFENEIQNRLKDYMKSHIRELSKTGLTKISLNNLQIAATGNIPGTLLNQFSMDEWNNNLRLASTIEGGFFWGFGGGNAESANDVYVLDGGLNIIGSVRDLGLTERIYSARFVEDRGYLVTFRQTDPFYVLDLSNPRKPEMKGELKIPGFSSYLHPLEKNLILGVGQEGGSVKLSLFNVSNPSNPTEISKYSLKDYWTEVQSTHHAFLSDAAHNIFFLPGGEGGYVFSYEGNTLSLKKAVSQIRSRRALYLNDYLYVVGDDRVVVLNEKSWETIKELKLE